jgi:uncharacterized protein (TIGR03437 family)
VKTTQTFLLTLVALLTVLCSIDTARAQSSTLTAYPPQMVFNGAQAPAQPLQISNSTGAVNFTVQAFSNNNWLVVSPTSGVTPATLSVFVGSTVPTSGSDVGFINISSSSGQFQSVSVQFNASPAGGPSPLSANPTSLSFNFAANSTVPVTQNVGVSSSSGTSSFSASAITNNSGNWLTVSPSSGSLPATLMVTVNPAALQGGGSFSGAIAVNAPGSNGVSIPVLVTVAGTPAINVSPAQLSFGYQIGTSQPLAQNLLITSSTGANVSFTASAKTSTCGNNWLVLTPQSGATPSTLSVQVNVSSLSAGTCTGEIDISAPTASNPGVAVQVGLLVSTNPLLQVPSTGPTFNYQVGSSTVPAAQNVQITSSTPGVSFTATASTPSGTSFLQVSPTTGTTPQALALSLNASALASFGPGTYTETVTITAGGAGNSPQSFPVTLIVNSNPVLTSTVPSLNFNYEIGQTTPSSQTVTINSTGAPLNYQVAVNATSCAGFLSAVPVTGSTFSPPPQSQNQVVVSVSTTGLTTPQVCSGNVTLTVPGSSTPPLVIPVTLNVSNTALLNVGQNVINLTVLAGASATTQTVSVTSTDPNNPLPFTAIASTNPVGLTWLSVTPNSGNTPNPLQVTINPANLGPGTYTGSIIVSSSAANVPAQTIPITLVVASSTVSATPASLTFTQSIGGSQPQAQTITIAGVPAGITIGAIATVLNGTGWLPQPVVSGNTVMVSPNGSQLSQGAYQGVVTVIVPGAGNSPLYVPVTLSVGPAPTLSVTPTTVNFTYASGSAALPPAQTVQVTSNGNVTFNASFAPAASIANRGNFITVTPASGTTPSALTLAVNGSIVPTLPPGTYSGTVTVSSPNIASQTINVSLTVSAAPPPVIMAITNAASIQAGPISPGEVVSIFGSNVGPATPPGGVLFSLTPSGTVPTTLGGVTVTFNGVAAPLLFVNSLQINAIVPYEIAGQTSANVVVMFGGSNSAQLQTGVVDTRPAIFSLSQGGSGQGAILNQDYSVNGTNQPAAKGSVIQIFGTGEGQLVPAVLTGSVTPGVAPFPKPVATNITVTIGGQPAQIQYAGEAPTLVSGVFQINAVVPASIASGNQPLVVTIGSNTNNTQSITVAVQ